MFTTQNEVCKVLCLNTFIPINAPILPPKKPKQRRVFSCIRHLFCFDFILSTTYKIKVIMLIRTKNVRYTMVCIPTFSNKNSKNSIIPYKEPDIPFQAYMLLRIGITTCNIDHHVHPS